MSLAVTAQKQCTAAYLCGPVKLSLTFDDCSLQTALDGLLSQYDAPWPAPATEVFVTIEQGLPPAHIPEPVGVYLRSYRLRVDRCGTHLISFSNVGVWMDFDEGEKQAQIIVPHHPDRETVVEEVEQQLVLLLARAWTSQGWTPLHAGSLIPPGKTNCVLVCAPSGVGKTTFISALLRRGWRTLGDDKVLLQKENGSVVARALSRRVHLHPALANWFPEIRKIEKWPRYSRWTEKRMVKMEAIWPGQWIDSAIPTGLVQLERAENGPTLNIEPLDSVRALNSLLRQIAIPSDAADARLLVSCAAAMAGRLRAALVTVGNNAFSDSSTAGRLEEALRGLLP
ncbi:MAG: hypothetical protein ABSE97_02795 [Verrucomicrobiota bacterium]|jgi:hypothetical protein